MSVDRQAESTRSSAAASRRSTVRRYLRLTATTRPANQHRFMGGNHSAASRAHLPEAPQRFTAGAARVRLSGSRAKRWRVAAAAAQRPRRSLQRAREIPARIGAVDAAAHGRDDARFDRLRIGVVAADIGRAAMFRRDRDSAPAVVDGLSRGAVPVQEDGACGDAGSYSRILVTVWVRRRLEVFA